MSNPKILKILPAEGFSRIYDFICEIAFNSDLNSDEKLGLIVSKLYEIERFLNGEKITFEEAIEKVREKEKCLKF